MVDIDVAVAELAATVRERAEEAVAREEGDTIRVAFEAGAGFCRGIHYDKIECFLLELAASVGEDVVGLECEPYDDGAGCAQVARRMQYIERRLE